MKILITGGNGYLMSHFRRWINDLDHDIWITQRSEAYAVKDNIILCDLTESAHIEKLKNSHLEFDLVIHAAANIEIKFCRSEDFSPVCCADTFAHIYKQNVLSTANIIEFIKTKKIKKLIFLSSQTVYGMPQNRRTVDETTPLNPLEHYALSKVMCEQLITLSSSYIDFQCIILRISGIFGGGRQNGIIYNMLSAAKSLKPLQLNVDYDLPFDIIHIDDVCQVLARLLSDQYWKQKLLILNCTSGESTNLRIISEDIYKITNVKHILPPTKQTVLTFCNKSIQEFLNLNFVPRYNSLEREWLTIAN